MTEQTDASAPAGPSSPEKRPNEAGPGPQHVKAAKVAETAAATAAASPNPKAMSSRAFLEQSVVPVLMQGGLLPVAYWPAQRWCMCSSALNPRLV